ncbi:hypothetical protein KC19_1G336100 [Ceratodon purpureus]|uniref:ABC transporter domain-containing protein n=1 Tax=Ceratodon purpureus TaxID=3225 RepID=A0A8T0JC88_CERPU|nr:hypothetical protein KC19_1G336100 [Ceratodon purpureus]
MAGSATSMEGIDIWGSRKASNGYGDTRGSKTRSSRSFSLGSDMFFSRKATPSRHYNSVDDDEEALKWAALEKLPTYDRLRTTILQKSLGSRVVHEEVDVTKIGFEQRRQIIDNLLQVADEDNERFLVKLRNRIDRVGIQLPTIEVRYENMTVDAKCFVGSRALPTLKNVTINILENILSCVGLSPAKKTELNILHDVSGIIKPGRMTLLLGPPRSGKTTLLLTLSGKVDKTLQVKGNVTYNGHTLDEFVPQKTSVYISQQDLHVAEMTVRETLDFSARCQGIGTRYEMLAELAKREKQAGIFPEKDVDMYMKATAVEGMESSLSTDYIMKILGLDVCSNVLVGDTMHRGISGGQKKRVTTGEMIVGPTKALFMDEISTGLDSSTTYQIVKCLSQFCHVMDATIIMSLLQPAPETFELFDDIVLLSEGQVVYHGPRDHILEFFESCGFVCPERKGVADFLQEVTSQKDQQQYWSNEPQNYRYVSVTQFAERFKSFHVGIHLTEDLATPYDKELSHKAALTFDRYGVSNMELFKANFSKEFLLMKRQSFVHVFKSCQIGIIALIAMTTFFRTTMGHKTEAEGAAYLGALFFGILIVMFNGYAELSMTIFRLPVFYKQRDLLFYPAWAFALPSMLLSIPSSIVEAGIYTLITYYGMGFTPEASRFFRSFLLLTLVHLMSSALFRLIAGICRTMVVANTGGTCALVVFVLLGGFIIPREKIKPWWIWGYWSSPIAYAQSALTVNEFLAPRWATNIQNSALTLGHKVMHNFGIHRDAYWYWIGIGTLAAYTILFNALYTLTLTYLDPLGKPQPVISEEALALRNANRTGEGIVVSARHKNKKLRARSKDSINIYGSDSRNEEHVQEHVLRVTNGIEFPSKIGHKRGMILPFKPLAMSFNDMKYFVDMPAEMRAQGVTEERLQLLCGVTGTFRPGVLTALVGVSGAGKTTLMDVLAGRKTGGYVEGEIRISGFPKKQETFARICGYCEQNDIHSPQVTVRESLVFSAWLRLPPETDLKTRVQFVEEVMELVELKPLEDALVGLPGVTGLSTEQRKRLTIAVELVANPSIVFMDEPTSGLDARAAAIVMRAVRNTVDTGRTVVCTIHQPSIDIFESFDEMLLMKRGGQVIYMGPLGRNSETLIKYFDAIHGVPKIKEGSNPATWMLEATSAEVESHLKIDFAEIYQKSPLFRHNKEQVKTLSIPVRGAKDLYFPTQYSQSFWTQCVACLWKTNLTYWRSPDYNCVRYFFTLMMAFVVGSMFWGVGKDTSDQMNLFSVLGGMFAATLFLGVNNASNVQPVVAIERTIFNREHVAGMYSAVPYAIGQMLIEIPYCLIQSLMFSLLTYSMMSLEWTVKKFFYYTFIMSFTLLYFTYYGMMAVALTPNHQVAAIVSSGFYSMFNLFSGFMIFKPNIPAWWVWYYWVCPVAWTLYGLVTTQFGDVKSLVIPSDGSSRIMVKEYIKKTFGMSSDMVGAAVAMPVVFTVVFAAVFAIGIKYFNFQKR